MTPKERIEKLIHEKGLNNSKLEKLAGISNGQIKKWDDNTSFKNIEKIAKYLNVSIDWILTGKEPEELTAEEKELVEHYRNANETNKKMIMSIAQIADQSENKAQISTFKIG